ncbi:Kae1-associated serine/threonine protein kinase [Candidatus Micrarchaeota archaeon]|nr:Kae1-associated serine/threonine protein kinase [Candidatus Micrarchaeota archaeon]
MKVLSEGAEAVIYAKGKHLVKKRLAKKYRDSKLDSKLRSERTRREAKVLEKAALLRVPKLITYNEYEIEFSKEPGVLASSTKLSNKTLEEIGKNLALLHQAGITHGDFTTSNILVHESNPVIIDFGLSVFSHAAEEQATDLLLFEKSVSEKEFLVFIKAYEKHFKNAKHALNRLEIIKQRARYTEKN